MDFATALLIPPPPQRGGRGWLEKPGFWDVQEGCHPFLGSSASKCAEHPIRRHPAMTAAHFAARPGCEQRPIPKGCCAMKWGLGLSRIDPAPVTARALHARVKPGREAHWHA